MLKKSLALMMIMAMAAFALAGCGQQAADQEADAETQADRPVTMVYVEWDCATASTNMAAAVIQEKLGHEVEILPVAAAIMWQAVGSGDADALVAAWLPATHGDYLNKVQDNIENLGSIYDGAKIGLVVPSYVEIDSIDQLNENAARFEDRIVGIDPGAGVMRVTEEVIAEYGLTNIELMEGSGATMAAALDDAIRNNQWIAVTGWNPHWMFGRWDLKYLEDPKGLYGDGEYIGAVVHKGFGEEMPDVYAFLDSFHWPEGDLEMVMAWNQEDGADPYQNAIRYMNEHPEVIAQWLGQ